MMTDSNRLMELIVFLQEEFIEKSIDDSYICSYLDFYNKSNLDMVNLDKVYNKNNDIIDGNGYVQIVSNLYVSDNHININLCLDSKRFVSNINKIIKFLNKEKIGYNIILNKKNYNSIIINLVNSLNIIKLRNFVINNINKIDIISVNPMYINDGIFGYYIDTNLSYNYVLSFYLYSFLSSISDKHIVSKNEFYSFMLGHYQNILSTYDLSKYLRLNNDCSNCCFLADFDIITDEIFCLAKGGNIENILELNDRYINKEKLFDKYKSFDNINDNDKLLNKVIIAMITKYGYDYTLKSLEEFKVSYNSSLITRINGLRSLVMNSNSFITYLNTIDIKELVDNINYELDIKDKNLTSDELLEKICIATYNSCQNEERKFSGKNQVARCLIRLSYGDYSFVTRNNNARSEAKERLDIDSILNIIRDSLEKNGYIVENEEDLYELYATHIEHICNKESDCLC